MRGLLQGSAWLGNATLPHPPIMEGVLKIIENAIREAWHQVCEASDLNGIKVDKAYEDQLTEALCKRLDYIRLQEPSPIPGFSPDYFESVQRESNWRDYQNDSIDKQPDLVFKFRGKRPNVHINSAFYDGLFVECKPVDDKHTFSTTYLKNGLSRFVNGTYAWAMQDAMMLGYISKSTNLNNKLIPELSKLAAQKMLKMSAPPTPCRSDIAISERCETRHDRDYIYHHNGEIAGSIRVRHLWLEYESTA